MSSVVVVAYSLAGRGYEVKWHRRQVTILRGPDSKSGWDTYNPLRFVYIGNTWYNGNMPKKSILQDKEAVAEAIANSTSIKESLLYLKLRAAGGNYRAFNLACAKHGLSIPQWDRRGQLQELGRQRRFSDEQVFVENSSYTNRKNVKKRLYALGVPEQCASCGNGPTWNGRPLTLTLEHKNGVWNDNRMDNLEILCPNCHSQTSTFCGGNK